MKKFEEVAMTEKNKNWKRAIKREEALYNPVYGKTFLRSEFDRDYTRIINCNAYKRLKGKTQVFFAPENDHICTRAEHVNLVDSISHTIAENLGLNAQLTKAEASQYNGSRSDINNHEVTVEFNCFPIRGVMVDKAAKALLQDITGVKVDNTNVMKGNTSTTHASGSNGAIYLDSSNYTYGIMKDQNPDSIKTLIDAVK